jgi:hypothetical protein
LFFPYWFPVDDDLYAFQAILSLSEPIITQDDRKSLPLDRNVNNSYTTRRRPGLAELMDTLKLGMGVDPSLSPLSPSPGFRVACASWESLWSMLFGFIWFLFKSSEMYYYKLRE